MKITKIEMQHIIESTDKSYSGKSVLKYQAIPTAYLEEDGEFYYSYAMYDNGLLQLVVTDRYCNIIANGESPF